MELNWLINWLMFARKQICGHIDEKVNWEWRGMGAGIQDRNTISMIRE